MSNFVVPTVLGKLRGHRRASPEKCCGSDKVGLQGLPQVGPKLATQLLNHFGTVEKVITTSEEELKQIKGLGRIKAEKIRKIVSSISG